jgi:hypothetical protein
MISDKSPIANVEFVSVNADIRKCAFASIYATSGKYW